MKIEHEIGNIGTFDSGDRKGFVDVIFHLEGETGDAKHGVVTVRAFFTDDSMSFKQLTEEARLISADVLSRLLGNVEVPAIPEELRQRWR